MFKRIPWQDVCKFLAGAFFVNAGILFYLYQARVSVPGSSSTGQLLRPLTSAACAPWAMPLSFRLFFHLGFIRRRKTVP